MLRLLLTRSGRRELAALRALERHARHIDALFEFDPHGCSHLDGEELLSGAAVDHLLCMHDHLNDIDRERA